MIRVTIAGKVSRDYAECEAVNHHGEHGVAAAAMPINRRPQVYAEGDTQVMASACKCLALRLLCDVPAGAIVEAERLRARAGNSEGMGA